MMKVTNCFMSKGNVSRVRAMLNGVMSMNSCRVVLIALLMLCGSGSVFAQLAENDIVTISTDNKEVKLFNRLRLLEQFAPYKIGG